MRDKPLEIKREGVKDMTQPTVQMLGRFQPWHDGHTALFKEALAKTGSVCIMVRNTGELFGFEEVESRILVALAEYEGKFTIMSVPNITEIIYGRDVGYKITKIELPKSIEAISATEIRRKICETL
jgi:hypothetical protein